MPIDPGSPGQSVESLADDIETLGVAVGTLGDFITVTGMPVVGVGISNLGQRIQANAMPLAQQIGPLPARPPMDTPWDWYVDGLDDLPGIGDDDNDDNLDDDYMDHINGGGHGAGWTDPVGPGSAVPIVLDLNTDGAVNLVSRATSTTFFDIDNDGYLERASWIGVDAGTGLVEDGFLVADFNADGHITADELALATATADPDDTDLQALASLFDSTQNGVINAADTAYAKLKVWKDLDQDGETDAGELHSLAHHGITSINVSSAWDTADAMTAAQLAQWGVTATDLTEEDLSDGSTRTVAALEGGNSLFGVTSLSLTGGAAMLAGDLALAVDPVGFRQTGPSWSARPKKWRPTQVRTIGFRLEANVRSVVQTRCPLR